MTYTQVRGPGLSLNRGIQGPKGDKPAHVLDGYRIAFQQPDGSFGPFLDVGQVAADEADRATEGANVSQAAAGDAVAAADNAAALVQQATAGFSGFEDGQAYDLGSVADPLTFFNRDLGTL